MNEHDEVVSDIGYSKYILRHFTNRLGEERTWGLMSFNVFGPGSLVLAITPDHKVVLERSYRIPMKAYVIELPGGSNDVEGESFIEIAARELKEETGYTGGKYSLLGDIPDAPGLTDQRNMIYLATGVVQTMAPKLGADEVIEVLEIPLDTILDFLRNSKDTVDPKIYAALMLVHPKYSQELFGMQTSKEDAK